ncbi:expressed unknown protein [Ectocarpus siliculosus]|uniref:Uncharacterized protein n=1 Tax=Ectocarpus siliculosus TaxID=2880 RepID=D8LJY9_ECTSI|nr:expressed unknown protein [Ectocarpus siliculosus]|eukprot:CBN74458.1 expressed unknown protein [Ectocarpus siliculosus]
MPRLSRLCSAAVRNTPVYVSYLSRAGQDGRRKHLRRDHSGPSGDCVGKCKLAAAHYRSGAAWEIRLALQQQEPALSFHQEGALHPQHTMLRRHGNRREEFLERSDGGGDHGAGRSGAVVGQHRGRHISGQGCE